MPVYMCNGCHPEHPCVLFAEGEFPLPDKCPWGYGTILKIVFGIDSGFVELKMAKTKEGDSDGN